MVRWVLASWSDAACTESVFMRSRMSVTVDIAPSAIWIAEAAWPTLTAACFRLTTSAFSERPMASEAASSAAESTRVPAASLATERDASASALWR